MEFIGVIGLLVAIAFLVVAVFRGYHVIPVTIVASVIAIVTNNLDLWYGLTEGYSTGLKNFVGNYIIMFFLGALLGQVLSKTGSARKIGVTLAEKFKAKNAITITVLTSTILAYGGVSVFVIVFAIYPICLYLFQQANMPKRLIPGAVMLGAGSYAMTAIPGTPALTNIIPTTYLGTTATAAPLMGIIAALVMMISGLYLYNAYGKRLVARGEVFTAGPDEDVHDLSDAEKAALPGFWKAMAPIIATIVVILGERVLNLGLPSVFSVIIGLFAGIVVCYLLNIKAIHVKESLSTAGTGGVVALLNTSAVVGLGGAVRATSAFQVFVNFALSLNLPAVLTTAIAVNIIAAITASSSAGITIFMETFAPGLLATGLAPQVLHRIAALGAGMLDSLPHAGPNVTFLSVAGLKFKEGYPGIFLATCIVPFIGLVTGIICYYLGIV